MLSISIRTHFKQEDIENLLYTAGSGSKYWSVNGLEFESCIKKVMEEKGITIEDSEDDKIKFYSLNLKKIKKGLTVMAKKYPSHFADIIKGDYDNTTGDIFLQCCIFGKIIYE
jgi:hypothetical protein